jgi:electron transfer flavoprotein alpha subunit
MERKDIWVVCDGTPYDDIHVLQMVSKAADFAKKKKVFISVVCIGKKDEASMNNLFNYSTDKVIFQEYEKDEITVKAELLKKIIKEGEPDIVFFSSTGIGKYLAAVCSTFFESGLTADCINIEIDDEGKFVFSRAALNDSIIASIKCVDSKIEMCTVKRNTFPLLDIDKYIKKAPNIEFKYYRVPEVIGSRIEILDKIEKELNGGSENNEWQAAKLVFAIGRGVENVENAKMIRMIAKKYDAEVIGTRAAVEENLIERNRQVGQSGVSICPNIYVGFGVSGACQHMVGIKNAKLVIAINSDENAPIFNYADYKIVDRVHSVLKEFCNI